MQKNLIALLTTVLLFTNACAQDVPNKEEQIAVAVMAAPEDQRDGAMVLGYDGNGKLITLKEGTNMLICVGDDPNRPGINVACYHKDLDAFMARGRELRAEGQGASEIFNTREEEAKAGTLKMPEQPTTLHLLEGPNGEYDPETGEVKNANYRYVVYIPWATAESTGLPLQPIVPGAPWIMDPGTHRAHIMITPPPKN